MQKGTGRIGGWLKHSFIDFPGTVSTVLFFCGCNLRCPYCHNPSLVYADDTAGVVDFGEVQSYLERRSGIIEGVVFSGGEPTLQRDALLSIAERVRALGLKIKLDTNGLKPEVIAALAPDYLALDLKTHPARYGELGCRGETGTAALETSLMMVKAMREHAEVRVTAAAPYVGEPEIESFLTMLEGVHTVWLQPVRTAGGLLDPSFGSEGAVPPETLQRWRDRLSGVAVRCGIRGETSW
jgi:pyruvate formate lyase activating enzyme